ncbi:MAG: sigma-70 family RNA polymerase sigma factor [Ruminococcaceae bacterium]|nr:sigma-70 family RNA polymerase sigma factor [Oscillospiraceae bacterium]
MQDSENTKLFTEYYNTKDAALREEIINKYMYLAKIITKKYLNKGVEYDDLFQVACVGLINAADRFNPNMGVEFATFATPTILGEIKRYFRDKGSIIKLPRKFYEIFQLANRIRLKRMQYDGYIPTIEEITDALNLEKKDLDSYMSYENFINIISLDSPVYTDDTPLINHVVGYEDDAFLVVENRDFIKFALKHLTNEEKRFIIHRYYRGMTQKQISIKWNVSQMYISRLERKTLGKLKNLYFK